MMSFTEQPCELPTDPLLFALNGTQNKHINAVAALIAANLTSVDMDFLMNMDWNTTTGKLTDICVQSHNIMNPFNELSQRMTSKPMHRYSELLSSQTNISVADIVKYQHKGV
jgi:hypothetical protein